MEVRGHALIYHAAGREITARGTMEQTEKQLSALDFLRCNNCYLVNPCT